MSDDAGLSQPDNKNLAAHMQALLAVLMLLCQLWHPVNSAKAGFHSL
jgi:hypothetical protein